MQEWLQSSSPLAREKVLLIMGIHLLGRDYLARMDKNQEVV